MIFQSYCCEKSICPWAFDGLIIRFEEKISSMCTNQNQKNCYKGEFCEINYKNCWVPTVVFCLPKTTFFLKIVQKSNSKFSSKVCLWITSFDIFIISYGLPIYIEIIWSEKIFVFQFWKFIPSVAWNFWSMWRIPDTILLRNSY